MNINSNVSNNVLFANRGGVNALKTVSALNINTENTEFTIYVDPSWPESEIEVEFRGMSEEEKLYSEMDTKFVSEFESVYLDKNRHFKGGSLEELYDKYQSLYQNLYDSDLSDKDKEIGLAALNDTFKRSSAWYSKFVQGEMMKQEFVNMKALKDSGQKVDKGLSQFYLKQRNAVNNSITTLSEKVMQYCSGNMAEKGISLKEFLNQGDGSKDIDNMTLDQVTDFENSLASSSRSPYGTGDYLDYFNGKSSDVDYQNSDSKLNTKGWLCCYSGLQSILDKYVPAKECLQI